MSCSFKVSTHELGVMGLALSNAASELRETADVRDDYGWAMGHAGVANALSSFFREWSDGMVLISRSCEALDKALDQALNAYNTTESAITTGLSGGPR